MTTFSDIEREVCMLKRLFRKALDIVLYAGLDREQYNSIKSDIYKENTGVLKFASFVGTIMFLVLFVMELNTDNFADVNTMSYALSFVGMVLIHIAVRLISGEHPRLTLALVYTFMAILNIYSVTLSMLHTEYPAVSAEVFLVAIPLVFIDRPIRLMSLTVVAGAAILFSSYSIKDEVFAVVDAWNTVSFTALAIIANTLLMRMKVTSLYRNRQIVLLSETDLLTEVKNRNCFETTIDSFCEMCRSNVVCVYADINGLHELNNSKGHAAGDDMLRFVAAELKRYFGDDMTFRLGGDEFLGVSLDKPESDVSRAVEEIRRYCSEAGYHVSFGIAATDKSSADMNETVRTAEERMYEEKRRFYGESADERMR